MQNYYKEIVRKLTEKQSVSLLTELAAAEGSLEKDMRRCLTEIAASVDRKGRNVARAEAVIVDGGTRITEPFLPAERLIILGGGHIALPVAKLGAMCGLQVCVVDDREAFATKKRFPMAAQVVCAPYPEGIASLAISAFDYVVIITHGHKYDADCVRAIIPGTMPAYLGMIGSRRRVSAQLAQLAEEGFDQERLHAICTPIGLNIGAVTPEEIAISIIAEVIAYRRLAEHSGPDRFCIESDAERSVLEQIARAEGPMALATVVEADGSTPRGAGAKMGVYPDGTIFGSVGGGMGEAAVIREAVSLIGTGRYKLLELDLTGDVSQYDMMACGGRLKVLIEDVLPE